MRLLSVLTLLFCSFAALAQPAAQSLEVFKPLVGKKLVSAIPGTEMQDTQEFSWIFGGKFLRNYHFVSNANGDKFYEGETIMAVEPATGKVKWWYFNSGGGYIIGTMELQDDGSYYLDGHNQSNDPTQPKETRAHIKNISEAGFQMTQIFKREGKWVEGVTFDFKAQ